MVRELAGCIITNAKGEVLLIHRNTQRLTQWELPGGKLEPDEEPAAAAARETLEEIGVEVASLKAVGTAEFDDNGFRWHYTWFRAEDIVGEPLVMEKQSFDGLDYFDLLSPALDQSTLSPNVLAIIAALESKQLQL